MAHKFGDVLFGGLIKFVACLTTVQRLKGASARFANRDGWSSKGRALRWDPGYDARTVARLALPDIRRYLDRQAEKHRNPLLARWSSVRDQAA